jgi:hypothetical protein
MFLTRKEVQELNYLESKLATLHKAQLADMFCRTVRGFLNRMDTRGIEELSEEFTALVLSGSSAVTSREQIALSSRLQFHLGSAVSVFEAKVDSIGPDELARAQLKLDALLPSGEDGSA